MSSSWLQFWLTNPLGMFAAPLSSGFSFDSGQEKKFGASFRQQVSHIGPATVPSTRVNYTGTPEFRKFPSQNHQP